MKKLILVLSLSIVGNIALASNDSKEKSNEKKSLNTSECCTAILTYNGVEVDREQVCGFITTGDNCQIAKNILLDRNPAAKKALSAN